MGVFGAFFGCRGDAGFSGPLLGVSSGVVGFNVAMLSCLAHEKVRPAWLVGGDSGRKFALHGQNASNWAILGEQGEFCPAHAVRRSVLGEFCTAVAPSVCPGAELPPPTGTAAIPAGATAGPTKSLWRSSHRLRWGFAALEAGWRRVVALMTPFPPFGDGSARPPPSAPAAPGVQARSASLARPRPCVLRPERIGLISCNLVLHSRVASAKIVVSTPTWRVIRPSVR